MPTLNHIYHYYAAVGAASNVIVNGTFLTSVSKIEVLAKVIVTTKVVSSVASAALYTPRTVSFNSVVSTVK